MVNLSSFLSLSGWTCVFVCFQLFCIWESQRGTMDL